MVPFLVVLSGLAWTVAYAECIRVGLRDRTYAMPLAALGLNIAWESTYAVHGLAGAGGAQPVINLVWALADLVIVYTFFRFGRAEFPTLTGPLFAGWGVLIFASSYAVQWLFIGQFSWADAAKYSAFLQNLLMSGLFIAMLVARRGTRGQSMLIAVPKWIGTLAPTIAIGVYEHSPFILGIGILCSVFDLAYIGLLRNAQATARAPAAAAPAPALAVRSQPQGAAGPGPRL
jgi:hypothetical protein